MGNFFIAYYYLHYTGGITQINECNPAMIAATIHPSSQDYLLTCNIKVQ